jgi:hypothetical protein
VLKTRVCVVSVRTGAHAHHSRQGLSMAHEPIHPKKELTRISLIDDAQIQHNGNPPAQTYPVLDRLAIMREDPKQPHKVAFEVRESRCVRGLSGIRISAIRGRCSRTGRWPGDLDLPKVDTREKTVEQTKGF